MSNFISELGIVFPLLMKGVGNTLAIFAFTLASAIPLGLIIMFGSLSKIAPIRWLSTAYIWLFRGTPLMLQLFFMYFFIPIVTNQMIVINNFWTAAITFGLNYAAYFAEIYRGGVQSIDVGQYEAAKVLGFSKWQTMSRVIIPQAVRRVIPSLSNEAITLMKDTSLIYVIGAAEILKYAKDYVNSTGSPLSYAVAAGIYLIFTFILTLLSKKLEKIFSKHERGEEQ